MMASSSWVVCAFVVLAVVNTIYAQVGVLTVAGGLDDSNARSVVINVNSIAFSNGNTFFTEAITNRIRLYTSANGRTVSTVIGTASGNAPGKTNILISKPKSLIYDSVSSNSLRNRYWFLTDTTTGAPANQIRILDIDYANEPIVTSVTTTATFFVDIASDYNLGLYAATTTQLFQLTAGGAVTTTLTSLPATNFKRIATAASGLLFAVGTNLQVYQYNFGTNSWTVLANPVAADVFLSSNGLYFGVFTQPTSTTWSLQVFSLPGATLTGSFVGNGVVTSFFGVTNTQVLVATASTEIDGYGTITQYGSGGPVVLVGGVPPRAAANTPGLQARFATPASIAVDTMSGSVIVGAYGSIDAYNPSTDQVSRISGTYGATIGQPVDGPLGSGPGFATVRDVSAIVPHLGNLAFYFLDRSETVTATSSMPLGKRAAPQSTAFVTSLRVLRLNAPGVFTAGNITTLIPDSRGVGLSGLALDRQAKTLYMADFLNCVIYRYFIETGIITTAAGSYQNCGDLDGTGLQARLSKVMGITVSPVTGMIYFSDNNAGSYKIKRLDPNTGAVTTIAGDGSVGQTNGFGTNSNFVAPIGLSVSTQGIIYVTSTFRIRAINETSGEVTTAAGSVAGYQDGAPLVSQLDNVQFIAVDNFRGGNVVYFFDSSFMTLRRFIANDVCITSVCNDGNQCTTDTCVSALGCIFTPNNLPCDDGNSCTRGDTCSGGICTGGSPSGAVGSICFNGNLCQTAQTCAANGACIGSSVVCNDENLCTVDSCDPARGCVFTQISCDDGNPCTRDRCVSNVGCINEPITGPCDLDNNPCTLDVCNAAGVCTFTGPNTCNDFDPCTIDSCVPSVGCVHTPPEECVGENFVRNPVTCSCGCSLALAATGCPTTPDPQQCLCLVPNTGSFTRLEVHYNSTFGDRASLNSSTARDIYTRNQLAAIALVGEVTLPIVIADNNGINGTRRMVIDVYGSNGLTPADVLSRLASASQCNLLPPACPPTSNSFLGQIKIFLLNPLVATAPAVNPPAFVSLPPYVDSEIDQEIVEADSESQDRIKPSIPIVSATKNAASSMMYQSMIVVLLVSCLSVILFNL